MTRSTPSRVALLGLLSLAQLMVILDISAVNVALPNLSRDLDIAPGHVEWTITSYSLLFGSLLLLGGRAADLLGRRRMFVAGLATFTAASLAAALTPNAGALYTARALQGVGAAMLSPAALSIITTTFSAGAERARALGVWGAVSGAGAAVGVLLGGVLTSWLGWRAIFFVNAPIGAVLVIEALRSLPADIDLPHWRGLDLRGAFVATVSLAALLYALAGAVDVGWTAPRTLGVGAAGLAGLVGFAELERRPVRPLLRIGRLADRAIAGGSILMLLASSILIGSFLLTSLYLQEVLGNSAIQTGLEFLPIAVAAAVGAHVGSQLVRRLGVRVPLALAFSLAGAGALLLSRVDADGGYVGSVVPGMALLGAGLGAALVSATVAVLTGARSEDAGMLSGLNNTGHEIGGAFGLAALTTIASQGIAPTGRAGAGAIASGLSHAYLAAAAVAGAGLVVALLVLPAASPFLVRLRESPAPVTMH